MSARDTTTGTVVAIKYLSADVYKGEFVQRYRDEVSALDRIEHPHVAQVFEYVEHGGSAAVITELVSGVSLREVIDTCGALDPQACLYVVKGALLGLGEAHGRGIVHRDVKPENLIVDGAGIVKVVDIGIPAPHRRAPGTPRYLAPELWAGRPASPGSDVYAASVVLFECLTGRPPKATNGKYLGVAGRPADDAVAAIRPGELPDRLRTLLVRGLAEQPAVRPADADALLDELEMAALNVYGADWETAGKEILARQMASPKSRGRRATVPQPGGVALSEAALSEPGPVALAEPVASSEPGPVALSRVAAAGFANLPDAALAGLPAAGPATTPKVPPIGQPRPPTAPAAPVSPPVPPHWVSLIEPTPVAPEQPRRRRLVPILVALGVLILLGGGTAGVLSGAFTRSGSVPVSGARFSHVPVASPGPTVPPTGSLGSRRDAEKPAQPSGLHVTGRSQSAVSLDWTPAFDNVKVVGYIVTRDGQRAGTTYEPGFTDLGLSPQTAYSYAVAAFDAAGNISPASASVAATTLARPDTTPPSVPTGLHWTGRSTTTVVLAWTASHDDVGVAGYDIVRDGKVVGATTKTTFTDTGLAPNSAHTYTVRAFDTTNNASGNSGSLSITTLAAPDTTPPTVPTAVNAAATGPDTINVTWAASTDNVGVAKYIVLRDGVALAEVSGTVFADAGLAADTTYQYRIRAVDAANNASAPSAPANGHTRPQPTPTPTTPPPTTDPPPPPVVTGVSISHTPISGCTTVVQATISSTGALSVTVSYTINGSVGEIVVALDDDGSTTVNLGGPVDTSVDGSASVTVTGFPNPATDAWTAPIECVTPPTDPGS